MYAHTILGIEYNEQTGQVKYLILDPHYTGPDVIKQVIERVSNSVKCIVSFRIIQLMFYDLNLVYCDSFK